MCVVIDSCTFSRVFDRTNAEHPEFKPVYEWIITGRGKIVFGGSKYKTELYNLKKYVSFINELSKRRKVVRIPDDEVDFLEKEVSEYATHRDFDDPHLIAIIVASGCKIICTSETRAIPFLKRKNFYPSSKLVPKLYTRKRNRNLLTDTNLASVCMPCERLTKTQIEQLESSHNI